MKYFLYRHIRLDTNEVFYVGIGKKPPYYTSIRTEYSRAFKLDNRNQDWVSINNNTEILIEIVLESDDYNYIINKEIEFILLYGRKDCLTGTLVNRTSGGQGINGHVMKESSKHKISKSKIGKKQSQEHIDIRIKCSQKAIVVLNTNNIFIGNFDSVTEASTFIGCSIGQLSTHLSGVTKTCKNHVCVYLSNYNKNYDYSVSRYTNKPILQVSLSNEIVKEFSGAKEASVQLNINYTGIHDCIAGRIKTAGGYKWQFKTIKN